MIMTRSVDNTLIELSDGVATGQSNRSSQDIPGRQDEHPTMKTMTEEIKVLNKVSKPETGRQSIKNMFRKIEFDRDTEMISTLEKERRLDKKSRLEISWKGKRSLYVNLGWAKDWFENVLLDNIIEENTRRVEDRVSGLVEELVGSHRGRKKIICQVCEAGNGKGAERKGHGNQYKEERS